MEQQETDELETSTGECTHLFVDNELEELTDVLQGMEKTQKRRWSWITRAGNTGTR